MIKFLISRGYGWGDKVAFNLARMGDLEILKYALENGLAPSPSSPSSPSLFP
jgi:hypothetical protein